MDIDEKVKKNNREPTHWSLYQSLLGLSNRLFSQEKIIKIILIISILNLILMILMLLK